ncbi:FAD-dependent oxidoreductase [Sphingomonas sp. G124]|uniref:FAD-dependent oxidoreductase n=1 Tax=Sphingomonas cremea TaxID=2904799 RepID=A0A9X1QPJ3_9SPHN|nr:FAD-dependent oxidoreductase [Sphingomonas cremea]MCF2515922.1 FAD-dependent oxidoreductase [Sphingomonas cremea]
MSRDPRYDLLFEPIRLGPVVARNRFFQVPHCNGMGYAMPQAHAAMREVKAEGGWAVVSTEECEIHPTGDVSPYVEARLWDDADIPALSLMCDKVHAHGSLAAIELAHNGPTASNLYSREVGLAPSHQPQSAGHPHQARMMSKRDIADFRGWHRAAALRAKRAGFDIVYVYAAHDLSLPMHFLQRRRNQRIDEYGGSLENRVRLLRELVEDTKDAVGDRCAVALRFATEEFLGDEGVSVDGEAREIVQMLADLPDLWDVNVSAWHNDSAPSRYSNEGSQEPFIDWVKKVTTKPVVGVGRFTSPDTMASQLSRGVLDMIGAARPSIADPFLPRKIEEGRIEDIRECIGCNICVSGDLTHTPIRCTQNPTMGEEWRKGWHPERIAPRRTDERVLIIGAGPAGLEAARALGQRGYDVHLAEATRELGGRVSREARLPGLQQWARVRDWRVGQIERMANVSVYRESSMGADDAIEFGAGHVVVATGCNWRRDGFGRSNSAIKGFGEFRAYTPDDLMDGEIPPGPVLLFDDDGYYYGSVLAEMLRAAGRDVTFVTPAESPAPWTANTLEFPHIQKRLREVGVEIVAAHNLVEFDNEQATLVDVWSGRKRIIDCASVLSITSRLPNDELFQNLAARESEWGPAGIKSVHLIGDALAPGAIVHAIYAGHRVARELDEIATGAPAFRRPIAGPTT